jgi:hypothetical protein
VVGVDGELILRPVVGIDVIVFCAAETAADIVLFDGGPSGLAGIEVDVRGVFDAVQAVGDRPGKVALAAFSFSGRLLHRAVLFDEASAAKNKGLL